MKLKTQEDASGKATERNADNTHRLCENAIIKRGKTAAKPMAKYE